jgi:protein MAK16
VEENVWKKVMRGLERSQEGELDEELDDGELEEDENLEREYEREGEEAEVEYVSDVDESDEEDDMEDFDDWLGGESADEQADGDSDEDDASDADDADEDDDAAALKKKLEGLKRKRPSAPPTKSRKKPSKGPRTNIEYERVQEPSQREMLIAK